MMNMEKIGIDLMLLSKIHLKESFVDMILTSAEKEEYNSKTSDKKRIEYLGGRFAAKEAIYKATQDKSYLTYSVLNDENGAPYVSGHPELSVSISHDGDYVVAIVLRRSE